MRGRRDKDSDSKIGCRSILKRSNGFFGTSSQQETDFTQIFLCNFVLDLDSQVCSSDNNNNLHHHDLTKSPEEDGRRGHDMIVFSDKIYWRQRKAEKLSFLDSSPPVLP